MTTILFVIQIAVIVLLIVTIRQRDQELRDAIRSLELIRDVWIKQEHRAVGRSAVGCQGERDPERAGQPMTDRDQCAALMKVIHVASHLDCDDPDECLDGIYTDEEIASAILAAGWRLDPYAALMEASQREKPAEGTYHATGVTEDGRRWWI